MIASGQGNDASADDPFWVSAEIVNFRVAGGVAPASFELFDLVNDSCPGRSHFTFFKRQTKIFHL